MIIGKSIKNVDKHLEKLSEGERFYVALRGIESYSENLLKYGIGIQTLQDGDTFLPRPVKNSTKYNANGKIVIDKSVKEERIFERSYHIVDWHGNDHYGTCYQSRMCYKRNLINPPESKLTYSNGFIISPILKNCKENKDTIKHVINMFLEMFGNCEILTEHFNTKETKVVKRLQWTVLPKGEYPWDKAKKHLDMILESTHVRYKRVINNRHRIISNKVPNFMAIGDQGFYGYVIYGFTKKNIYIFESNQPDNATYVFKGNWEDASKLSKLEIMNSNLCEARLIHNKNWESSIDKIIN
ncbi:hypothetical protein JY742_18510 [Clostridioides difficile]|nr:hypothetical protein [Clostridioides difficile]